MTLSPGRKCPVSKDKRSSACWFLNSSKSEEKGAVIDVKPGLMGFELVGRMEEVLPNCEELTAPYYLGAFALADINDEDYYLK